MGTPARVAIWIASTGFFSGAIRPRKTRWPPSPRPREYVEAKSRPLWTVASQFRSRSDTGRRWASEMETRGHRVNARERRPELGQVEPAVHGRDHERPQTSAGNPGQVVDVRVDEVELRRS